MFQSFRNKLNIISSACIACLIFFKAEWHQITSKKSGINKDGHDWKRSISTDCQQKTYLKNLASFFRMLGLWRTILGDPGAVSGGGKKYVLCPNFFLARSHFSHCPWVSEEGDVPLMYKLWFFFYYSVQSCWRNVSAQPNCTVGRRLVFVMWLPYLTSRLTRNFGPFATASCSHILKAEEKWKSSRWWRLLCSSFAWVLLWVSTFLVWYSFIWDIS